MLKTFYNAYLNTLTMLVDRKYINEDKKKLLYLTFDEFIEKKKKDISLLNITNIYTNNTHQSIPAPSMPVIVLFFDEDFKTYKTYNTIKEILLNRITENELNTHYIICIYQSKNNTLHTNEELKKKDNLFLANNIKVQFFTISKMATNILNNKIMSKVKLMNQNKISNIYNPSQMNSILSLDPVVRYFGASQGDIFKFIREGPSVAFKRVI